MKAKLCRRREEINYISDAFFFPRLFAVTENLITFNPERKKTGETLNVLENDFLFPDILSFSIERF